MGNTYNHLATTITNPQQDLNLGIETYLNGSPMNPIQLDTSQVAKDTIDYVATDQSGLTSTTTRTVIIEAPSITHALHDTQHKLSLRSIARKSKATSAQIRDLPKHQIQSLEIQIRDVAKRIGCPSGPSVD